MNMNLKSIHHFAESKTHICGYLKNKWMSKSWAFEQLVSHASDAFRRS